MRLTVEEKQILSAAATIRATRMWAKRSKKDRVAHAKMMNQASQNARNAKKVDK